MVGNKINFKFQVTIYITQEVVGTVLESDSGLPHSRLLISAAVITCSLSSYVVVLKVNYIGSYNFKQQ